MTNTVVAVISLLGYPKFSQSDPRSEGDYSDYVLLLQIDSIGTDKHEIMWHDAGECNFFIKKEDLENCDFSNILYNLYNWDCG